MKKNAYLVALLVLITTLACGMPAQVAPTITLVPTIQLPSSTPILPTAMPNTGEVGLVPVAGKAAPEVATVAPPSPTPQLTPTTGRRAMPVGVVNIMVLGSDSRSNLTDVMMLVSVNTMKQTVSVISFPRDLYLPISGWKTQRLNAAKPHGGFETLAVTMEENFDVRPAYYVQTNFAGFRTIIDSLGGINVYAGATLTDRCDLPIGENGKCTIHPGLYRMDGATALWYVRSRYTTSDLDRLRRAQEVLSGIFMGFMSAGTPQDVAGLYERYQGIVETNLTAPVISTLLPAAARVYLDPSQVRRYALTIEEAKPFVTETGAQVLLPDYERINQILDEAIFNP